MKTRSYSLKSTKIHDSDTNAHKLLPPNTPNYNNISINKDIISVHQTNTIKTNTEKGNFFGMILVTLALFIWTIGSAIITWRIHISTLQYYIFTCGIALIYCVIVWIFYKPKEHTYFFGDTKHDMIMVFIFSVINSIQIYLFQSGLKYIYVGDMDSIYLFIGPLLVALIGHVFFKEKLPKYVIITAILCLIGGILITQPSFIPIFDKQFMLSIPGFIISVISVILYSIIIIIIAQNPQINWLQFQICTSTIGVFILSPIIYVVHTEFNVDVIIDGNFMFDYGSIMYCVIVGICCLLSEICLIYGYQMGASTKIVWLEYVDLVFAYIIQWIIFKKYRNYYEIIGAFLIGSTVLIQFYNQYKQYKMEQLTSKIRVNKSFRK